MAIQFTCPHCGTQTQVADQYAGQTGPCGSCGQTITVPLTAASGAPTVGSGAAPPAKKSAAPIVLIVLLALCAGAVPVIAILVALLLPAISAAREAARRNGCMNNVRQINLAMLNYESVHGQFPPAYIADEQGRPMHSWRVLLLPYMEEQALYEQYDFDKPWDSPENMAVGAQMPNVYACPSAPTTDTQETSYLVVVGLETVFPGGESTRIRDMRDGTSNTITVVEASQAAVHWLEPTDLDFDRLSFTENSGDINGLNSFHAGDVVVVGFADAHVQTLAPDLIPDELKAMVTRAGGD